MKRIFIISGEKSGDIIAEGIIQKIQNAFPNCQIQGIGGESFSKNGLKSLFNQNELSIMGFFEILPKIFRILKLIKTTVDAIKEFKPEHVITIDSPGFNFVIAKKIKDESCKIHHIVAPSVWAYKKNRAKKVAKLYNTLFCILPFEPPYFTQFGLKTIFIGYPPFHRIDAIKKNLASAEKTSKTIIPITLGSRLSEVKKHTKIVKQTIATLNGRFTNIEFVILTLPHLHYDVAKSFSQIRNVNVISNEEKKWQTVQNASFVLAKSGTNVMEFALLGIPSIVFYRANIVTEIMIKIMAYTKFATLLNFTANRHILPEFLQNKANGVAIAMKAKEWLEQPEILVEIKREMNDELKKFESAQQPQAIIFNEICNSTLTR
jgi:lipid-A-disaccharide synthase